MWGGAWRMSVHVVWVCELVYIFFRVNLASVFQSVLNISRLCSR